MDKICINGGVPLHGVIVVGGAKNAALPLMAASLLTEDTLTLTNVPHLVDINTMIHLLIQHGVVFNVDGTKGSRVVQLRASDVNNLVAPYDIVRKMRASVWVLGPLLARFGEAKVSLPGGCAIGTRPIDMHLSALEQMGASIELIDGYVHASVNGRLQGADIHFSKVSVGATVNVMMAASLADGETHIHNAACEPEVCDLGRCLIAMGADIEGIGTRDIIVRGVPALHGTEHHIIPDRIESGTFAAAAAITGGELLLSGVTLDIMGEAVVQCLRQVGVTLEQRSADTVFVKAPSVLTSCSIATQPYPGFPTDMQAQLMALMTVAQGESLISETIFENRFMHVPELLRMGANIQIDGNNAVIEGVESLSGAQVMATDLRASVSLVLAGLAAKGQTILNRVYHIDRGYEWIEDKLSLCGADIRRFR